MNFKPSILLLLFCFVSCNSLHEARETIAEADSLRAAGVAYDDSLRLDSAYHTLGSWWNRNIHPDDYAGACYYYGRLHRNRGNQVEAMRCFINGTHAQYLYKPIVNPLFSNHSILGRTYSNMGTMCHTIEEYQLSYDMYEKCSMHFKKANDTTAFYYALNDMAFELADMKEKERTLALLDTIEHHCKDYNVLTQTWETKAELYKITKHYDSAVYCINVMQSRGYLYTSGYIIKAQALWFAGNKDSALLIAKHVMQMPDVLPLDKYHMLYITSHDDPNISKEDVNRLNSDRADVDNYILKPEKQRIAAAAELLKQRIEKKPEYGNIVSLLIVLVIIVGVSFYLKNRYKKSKIKIEKERQLLLSETEQERLKQRDLQREQDILILENGKQQQKQNILREQQQQLLHENENIIRDNELIRQQYDNQKNQLMRDVEGYCNVIRQSEDWRKELCWDKTDELFETVNKHFYNLADKLKATGKLDEKEIRLCILVLLDMFDNKKIAEILFYSEKGIRTYKSRINNKLGNKNNNFRENLLELTISGIKIGA